MKIECDLDLAMDVDSLLNGSFYPLKTFLNKSDLDSVLKNLRLKNGKPWPMPVLFPAESLNQYRKGEILHLYFRNKLLATLKIQERFQYDLVKYCRLKYGTLSKKYPGVVKSMELSGFFVTGALTRKNKLRDILKVNALEPKEVKKKIKQYGWKKVVAFHTRNPPHNAHEYLQKCALETNDGILLHPVIGRKKKGDFSSEAIIKSYKVFVKEYYPKRRAVFTPLLSYSRYAGPREALFTAIVRRNFGCTSFIVGRDHTGVGKFYHVFASQEIFDKFPDLGIQAMCFHGPFYCMKNGQVATAKTSPGLKEHVHEISGTYIRNQLKSNKKISKYIMRSEVIDALREIDNLFV